MPSPSTAASQPPSPVRQDGGVCYLSGEWTVNALAARREVARRRNALPKPGPGVAWNLMDISRLDTVGAQLIWQAWGFRLPEGVQMTDRQRAVFETLRENAGDRHHGPPGGHVDRLEWLRRVGDMTAEGFKQGKDLLVMFGQFVLDVLAMVARPWRAPWAAMSAQVYHMGAQALGITALVGFLIGVVLSYLSAQQLRTFGADRFIVQLLGVSVVRELGPVLAAILVAGRSGSAITAQLGVMRVTQELDAMQVMGISHSRQLILPRVLALSLAMPLLVLWTDALALFGGMLAARAELNISEAWFIQSLPDAISMNNYRLGLLKGATFGALVAMISCHFGLRIQPNTESLGRGTTTSVVTSITGVILVDALYAIICSFLHI
jgi:phospholipid/cholesterol/gamma-HCH transport system permease protein